MAILSSPLQIVTSTPPATRTFTALLVSISLAYYWLQWRVSGDWLGHPQIPYLTLVPGISWIYPWTFLTSSFVEKSVIELAFSLICLPVSLRYLERLWGTVETFKFIGIVLIISNIVAFIISWIEFELFGLEFFIYGIEYHGQMALQTAVLVAFTQMIPEHQVQLFGVLKVRVKRLPMAYVTFSTVLCIMGYQDPFILIQFGWLVSWFYLRFYKRTGGDTGPVEYGDRSETFAFVHWFPPFLHYPISIASNATYTLCLRIKLVKPHSSALSDIESQYSAPGGTRAEAERRRALALKALDQRLANPTLNPGATSSNPSRQNSASPTVHAPKTSTGSSNSSSRVVPEGEADLGVSAENKS